MAPADFDPSAYYRVSIALQVLQEASDVDTSDWPDMLCAMSEGWRRVLGIWSMVFLSAPKQEPGGGAPKK